MGHVGLGLAAFLCLLALVQAEPDPFDSRFRCREPPGWEIDGQNPIRDGKGTVTVVALLKAS